MSASPHPESARDLCGWNFGHSYASLPGYFFSEVRPEPVRRPSLVVLNRALAGELGLDGDALQGSPDLLVGNRLPPGSRPLAQAYAGHQYAHFTNLGDGRAILLGEQITPEGLRFDIQLKGAGPTPYSRRGDGRAALGPMLREFLVSEAMAALGIPTTRSLAVTATGEPVFRETPLPGAVLTRVAASHIRVGTFEWAAACGKPEAVAVLADYTLARHFPDLAGRPDRHLAFYAGVVSRQAALLARWQLVGFVHGVMNTDNMAVSGETIDYGPCAFLDTFDPSLTFSSIDRHGRYAYGQQPTIAHWNLARLGEALMPLFDPDPRRALELANQTLSAFPSLFEKSHTEGLCRKLGLDSGDPANPAFAHRFLGLLEETRSDFTATFADLTRGNPLPDPRFADWLAGWKARIKAGEGGGEAARKSMQAANPAIIPRNHVLEDALQEAVIHGDFAPFHRLLQVLADPFNYARDFGPPAQPPPADAPPYVTFCGT